MQDNARIKIYIGSIIMVVLQLIIAPIISINAIVPNFLLAFTISCAIARPDLNHLIYAFIMGLIFDLICNGPLGAMAFVMVVAVFLISIVLTRITNINLFISILTIIVSTFVVEFIYGVFQVSIFVSSSFIEMLSFRVLPCTLYDLILGVIIFPIMARITTAPVSSTTFPNDIDSKRW